MTNEPLQEEPLIPRLLAAYALRAYLHEIYYMGKHRLTRKYWLIRNGLWSLLFGLPGGTVAAITNYLPL